ncbi:LLM class flavin-dependent oxidoreductase [Kineosporia sp. R_H_3]|uniref:LLM class flavin-dependent oxidoreductase n=1 Tax=Kineosporia sp. R_H_3 TaxID=1961848 RepID=UPI000B4B0491|nr:LLM class flavin-dependent oxidoreductase [Kineosporia sp. R_H_3]
MTVVGAIFVPALPPERLRSVAVAADDAGVEELWLWEDCFREGGLTASAAALAWTTRVRLGIGILPLPLRNAAITAMEVATLARLFPDRFVLGVGHGVQDWMAQVGARPASPLGLMREHLTAYRDLFAGRRVTTSGTYVRLDDVGLDWPPSAPVPVHVGATGPKTLALAGELGDGTVLTGGTTPDQVRAARTAIDAGRAAGGRTDRHRVTVFVMAAVGADAEQRLRADARLWPGIDPDGEVGVHGADAEEVARRLRRWTDAGADAVILQPTGDVTDHEAFVALAAQVAPHLAD